MKRKYAFYLALSLSLLVLTPSFAFAENETETPNVNVSETEEVNIPEETSDVQLSDPEKITSEDTYEPDDFIMILDSLEKDYNSPNGPIEKPREKIPTSLGSCTTKYNNSSYNRKFNVNRAANSLNGVIVKPGETFDFNKTVGPAGKAQGYKLSGVFANGKDARGYGGGLCQVSSTLFNAALRSGMDIKQRRAHSMRVHYLPAGFDATVNYPELNFKFKNVYEVPVQIKTSADGSNLTIKIVATESTVPFVTDIKSYTTGNRTTVTRVVKRNGQIVKTDKFNSSYSRN